MSDENDEIDVEIMGVKIGKASGWDQADTSCLTFYDFIPLEKIEHILKPCTLSIDPFAGLIEMSIPIEEEHGAEDEVSEEEMSETKLETISPKKFMQMLLALEIGDL